MKINKQDKIKRYRVAFGANDDYILNDLKKAFYYNQPTYVFGEQSPIEDMYIREGMRMAILHIERIIKQKLEGE